MRIEQSAACVMCGSPDAEFPIGSRWLCRPDAERLSWHLSEAQGLAELCGINLEQLRRALVQ